MMTLLVITGLLGLSALAAIYALSPHRKPVAAAAETPEKNLPALPALASPEALKPIAPQDAETQNAARPNDTTDDPPAAPFVLPRADAVRWNTAVSCLTAAVYYEAASEPIEGQRAVAQVVLNRVRHPAFPKSVCGVVYDGWQQPFRCQFSFACDGSMKRKPSAGGWALARTIAESALSGYVVRSVGHATHYHANFVIPYWADQLSKVATLGRHIFYRWPGFWGTPAAFRKPYAGVETNPFDQAPPALPTIDLPPDALLEARPILSSSGTTTPLNVDRAPKVALLADQQKGTLIVDTPKLIEKNSSKLAPAPSTPN